jgi:hypothetical protein
MVFLVTYDLRVPGKDYTSLYAALERYPDRYHSKTLGSVWFIRGHALLTSKAIYDDLVRNIDPNDRLFVTPADGATGWMDPEFWPWYNR